MKPREAIANTATIIRGSAWAVIFVELTVIAKRNKKTAALVILGELWLISLGFHHLSEAQSIYELLRSFIP